MTKYEKLKYCYDQIRNITDFKPEIALILGSGLGDFAEGIDIKASIEYSSIDKFPVSTVSGHKGRFVFGYSDGKPIVIMQGRVHYYEGYSMEDVVLPTRLMGMLSAKTLILTNAAGGINTSFTPGTLMMIKDHISSFVPSPLVGPNVDELGTRFPDMSKIYTPKLQEKILSAAAKIGIDVKSGVYLQTTGPNFESPAEIRMYRTLGADAVGMSTACEAIAARHMGMDICGISCISNLAAGMSDTPLTHEEVKETADRVSREFKLLVKTLISEI